MADLILKTRLDVLRSNLQRVTEIESGEAGSVENLRAELQWLLCLPDDMKMKKWVQDISMRVTEGKNALRFTQDSKAKEALSSLHEIEQILDDITDYLIEAQAAAKPIQSRALRLHGERDSPWSALEDGLIEKAQEQIKALRKIEDNQLAGAAAALQQGDEDIAAELLKRAWEVYSDRVYQETNQVFCEYLDFLSGLALRDIGVDQGMCQIADRLLRDNGRVRDFAWDSLTIPAQHEALQATLAKIVRLGFPEWTMWALPLAVHELGQVVVTTGEFEEFVRQQAVTAEDRHRLQVCLADAFATNVMGPAYACAVILLRLDPWTAFAPDERLTEKRARVVLATLEAMDQQGSRTETGRFSDIRTTLEREWDEALRQVGISDSLGEQETEEIQACVKQVSKTTPAYRALSPKVWPRVEELADLLDRNDVENVKVAADDNLRVVLNAAWKWRIDKNDLSRVSDIDKAVVKLWQIIETGQEKGGDRFPTPQPPPSARTWAPAAKAGAFRRPDEGR